LPTSAYREHADVDIALRQAFQEVFGAVAARLPQATV